MRPSPRSLGSLNAVGLVVALVSALAPVAEASYRDVVSGTPGLAGYWRLGEAAGATAPADQLGRSRGSYSGVGLGTAGLVAGDANTAGRFSPTGSGMQVRIRRSLRATAGFTLEAWVAASAIPTVHASTVVAKLGSYHLTLTAGNRWQVGFLSLGGQRTTTATSGASSGSSQHVVGTYDGSTLRLYVDGVQVASTLQAGSVDATTRPLRIGSPDGASNAFSGTIDDVAVYDRALSSNLIYGHWISGSVSAPAPGVVTQVSWGDATPAQQEREVALMAQAGVRWARVNASWANIERSRESYDPRGLMTLDASIAMIRAAGIQIVLMVDSTPCWASADPGKRCDAGPGAPSHDAYWRPVSFDDYAGFLSFLASRYRRQGVHVYEIWNEPNLARFWPSQPAGSAAGAEEYARMLRSAAPALRQADPSAVVLTAGIAGNRRQWLEAFYASSPSPRSSFDALAIHPYAGSTPPTLCWGEADTRRNAQDAFCGLEGMRDVMVANGDAGKEVWLTEVGWSTYADPGDGSFFYGVSEDQQASYIVSALDVLEGSAPGPYGFVRVALVYQMRDWGSVSATDPEAHYGLLRNDWNGTTWSAKPSYAAFSAWATARP